MGGTMWAESDGVEHHGSTFWFTAKFQTPPFCSPPISQDMFKDMLGLVVDDNLCVVDDNSTSGQILVDLLRKWGLKADAVNNVEEALSSLKRAAISGQKYNVVLLDMWLSGTDASELVSFLRDRPTLLQTSLVASAPLKAKEESLERGATAVSEEGADQSNMERKLSQAQQGSTDDDVVKLNFCENLDSIILLTSASHTDTTRCKELGVRRHHVSKPIKHSLLLKALQSALGAPGSPSSVEGRLSKEAESPAKSLHILVAEDNVVNQRVVVILLKKWGYTAVIARNGAEAVEQAAKETFDLILMDVQMPVCDGITATAQIREMERSQQKATSTPIVAMTAHAMSGDGERCWHGFLRQQAFECKKAAKVASRSSIRGFEACSQSSSSNFFTRVVKVLHRKKHSLSQSSPRQIYKSKELV